MRPRARLRIASSWRRWPVLLVWVVGDVEHAQLHGTGAGRGVLGAVAVLPAVTQRPARTGRPGAAELGGAADVRGTAALGGAADVRGAGRAAGRVARRARVVALVVGGFLAPWCVLLGVSLPTTASVQHWSLAWAGLDAAEAVAALATAVLLGRGSPRAGLTAAAGAALLLTDAWFDICTSAPGLDRLLAAGEAIFAELPLAGAAIWLAVIVTRKGG